MRVLVTCGPTYENLDKVRRLTNFSTGKLGIGLANFFSTAGHHVHLLKGYYAICTDASQVPPVTFTTTEDLFNRLRAAARERFDVVFHVAAVSDFRFGAVYHRNGQGQLESIAAGKLGTRTGHLLAELVPTPKLISHLREFFPDAKIFGWKYEVDGSRESAIELGRRQLRDYGTNYSVVNGPAYGQGFGVVAGPGDLEHCASAEALYPALLRRVS